MLIIVLGIAAVGYFRWYEYLSFSSLSQHRDLLMSYVQQHYLQSLLLFILLYVLVSAFAIPGAVFLTVGGGFLFGPWLASLCVVWGASLGAALLFWAVRLALREYLAGKARGWLAKLEKGFQADAFSYLLVLRLVPLFPFWVVNIVPALLGVRFMTFFVATFIGIIPGTVVYCLVGNGLSHLLASGQQPDLAIVFSWPVLLPLILLALLSLLPVFYKQLKRKKDGTDQG
jgi:uncharacterized membrane protein YdjX (TVP38/TMEM64 family)